jgi:tetratricopeptide (TPR) repeat protein
MNTKKVNHRFLSSTGNQLKSAICLLFIFFAFQLQSQPITNRDANLISDHALKMINEFQLLLNTIVRGSDIEPSEMDRIIHNSYALENKTRYFFDSTSSLEDDIKPKSKNVKRLVQPVVGDYLEDLHNFYLKSDTNSIFIKNIYVSKVKKDAYIYVKVYFDYLITNKSIISDAPPHDITKKVAEMRVEKIAGKWHAWIVNVHFLTNAEIADPNKNNVDIAPDPPIAVVNTAPEKEESDSVAFAVSPSKSLLSNKEKKRIQQTNDSLQLIYAYSSLINDADKARKEGDTSFALQRYHEASLVKPEDSYAKNQMTLIERQINRVELTPQQLFDFQIQKAHIAENERKYDSALNFYRAALNIKPDDTENHIKDKIQQLSVKSANISRVEVKIKSGQYKDALEDCKSLIKKDAGCTDYFVLIGKCYFALSDFKKAKENYLKAISLDATNQEAYKLCGSLDEKLKDLPNAIANYRNASNLDRTDLLLYLKLADLNISAKQTEEAIHDLDHGIQAIPDASGLFQKKGEILYKAQKFPQAEDNFSLAIERDGKNSSAFYYRGMTEIELKQIASAGNDFTTARVLGLDSPYQLITLSIANNFFVSGQRFFSLSKLDSTLLYLNAAILINPSKSEYRFTRGEFYMRIKDFEHAVDNYTQAIQLKNNYVEAHKQRGLARMNQKRYPDAANDFDSCLQLTKNIPELYKMKGDAYFMLNENNEAISLYNSALTLEKDAKVKMNENILADLYNNFAECYFRQANYSVALVNFKNALHSNKASAEINFNLGKTYLQINELKDAESFLSIALQHGPHLPFWYYTLGILYQKKADYKQAIAEYNLAITMDSAKSLGLDPWYNRGFCLVSQRNFDEALKDYKTIEANKGESKYPQFYNELGTIFLEKNLAPGAERCFRRSLAKDSLDADAQYGMAIAFVQQKQIDLALNWFEKSFSSGKLKKKKVSSDPLLTDIKDNKQFKQLIKKYL